MDEEVVHFGPAGEQWRAKRNKPDWESRPSTTRQRARILIGHGVYWGIHQWLPNREPRYLTFFREPTEQLVSLYNYKHSKGRPLPPFEKWVQQAPLISDELKRQLRGAMSMDDYLETCWYIGTTSSLDSDLSLISRYLGVPTSGWRNVRVAGSKENWVLDEEVEPRIEKVFEVDDSLRDLVQTLYPQEYELWEKAQRRRDQLFSSLSATSKKSQTKVRDTSAAHRAA